MNTLERESIATELQSAAEHTTAAAPEETRDEALSQIMQSWQVAVDTIDISETALARVMASQPLPVVSQEIPMLLSPVRTPAMEMAQRLYNTEQSVDDDRQIITKSAWRLAVLKLLAQQLQDHVSRSLDIAKVPLEFIPYLDFQQGIQIDSDMVFPSLSAEQDQRLAEADAEKQPWIREVRINANLSLVPRLAKPYLNDGAAPKHVFATGLQALVEAAESYMPNMMMSFSVYAMAQITRTLLTEEGIVRDAKSPWEQVRKHWYQETEESTAEGTQVMHELEERLGSPLPTPVRSENSNSLDQKVTEDIWRRLQAIQQKDQDRRKAETLRTAAAAVAKYEERGSSEPVTVVDISTVPDEFFAYLNSSTTAALANERFLDPLTADQELRLAQALRQGALWAREVLFKANLHLVTTIAKQNVQLGREPKALHEAGLLGLQRAIDSFDAERGFRFATYATQWVQHAIRDVDWRTAAAAQPPTPPHPPTAVGAPAPLPEPEEELRRMLQATISELRTVKDELNTLRTEVSQLRQERAQPTRTTATPPRPSTARLFPFTPPERG